MRKGLVAGALAGLIVAALGGVGGPALRLDAAIPAPLQVGPSDPSLPELNLVVLGDSYASAALPFDRGTLQVLGAPSVCARGPAWPRLLMPANMRLSLTHVSCSGAVVADLIDRRMRAGEILQVQALSEETDIVMLGIGGNDAGFSEVFAACRTEDAAACVTAGERMKPQAAALSGSLVRLYRTVLAKAPNAVVIVVMYADSLPAAPPDSTHAPPSALRATASLMPTSRCLPSGAPILPTASVAPSPPSTTRDCALPTLPMPSSATASATPSRTSGGGTARSRFTRMRPAMRRSPLDSPRC